MKKILSIMAVLAVAAMSFAGYRTSDGQPNASDVYSITITKTSRLSSIICDVTASGETNSFTITADVISYDNRVAVSTNTYTYATAVTDDIAGAEVAHVYNADADLTTDDTMWLKPGSVLKLTGNDAAQTDYTNVWYYVVLETAD